MMSVKLPFRIIFYLNADPEEYEEIKRHSEVGHRIAKSSLDLCPIADFILKHHERWDGEGYPLGLKEKQIPLECRLLAIVDAYDAMTSDRPYRKAMTFAKALSELQAGAGTQFDPEMVQKFIEMLKAEDEVEFATEG
jgi:HD-GYP domain-containing protein (c-di-GMP phosphodiesterase class II)